MLYRECHLLLLLDMIGHICFMVVLAPHLLFLLDLVAMVPPIHILACGMDMVHQ